MSISEALLKALSEPKDKAGATFTHTTNAAGGEMNSVSNDLPSGSLGFDSLSISDTQLHQSHSDSTGPAGSLVDQTKDVNERAPISQLPPEVLSVVFTFHVRDYEQSPWTLMQVNRAWRASALVTKTIWVGMEIVPKWQTSDSQRSREGREVCTNYDQLQRAIARAKGTPLDLKFDCETPAPESGYGVDEWSKILTSFDHISPQITLESLTILGRPSRYKEAFITNLDPSRLQVLKLLRTDEDLLGMWAETARALQTLELDISVLPYANQKQVWWKDLKQLTFTNPAYRNYAEEPMLIRGILEWTTSLRVLEFTCCSFGLPDDEALSLPALEELRIRGRFKFPVIDAPLLKKVTLDMASFHRDKEYPLLTHLQVTGVSVLYQLPMHTITAPSLHTLVIGDGQVGQHLLETWPTAAEAKINPLVLHCRNMYILPFAFSSALCAMTQLEELYLESINITAPLINSLAPSESGLPCPHLQAIIIIVAKNKDIGSLADFIRPTLQLRAKARSPLREAKIRTLDSDKWLDLLS